MFSAMIGVMRIELTFLLFEKVNPIVRVSCESNFLQFTLFEKTDEPVSCQFYSLPFSQAALFFSRDGKIKI